MLDQPHSLKVWRKDSGHSHLWNEVKIIERDTIDLTLFKNISGFPAVISSFHGLGSIGESYTPV